MGEVVPHLTWCNQGVRGVRRSTAHSRAGGNSRPAVRDDVVTFLLVFFFFLLLIKMMRLLLLIILITVG